MRLRRCILRQDSLLALSFDHASVTSKATENLRIPQQISYQSAMDQLSLFSLKSGYIAAGIGGSDSEAEFESRLALISSIDQIRSKTDDHLITLSRAVTINQRCEHFLLDLHFSFVKAWVCRPALRQPPGSVPPAAPQRRLVETCIGSLRDGSRAFIELYRMCNFACRSWSTIHNGLSSALLLALLGQTSRDQSIFEIIQDLLGLFPPERQEFEDSQTIEDDDEVCLSTSHQRAISVLRRLCSSDAQASTTALNSGQTAVGPNAPSDQDIFQDLWYVVLFLKELRRLVANNSRQPDSWPAFMESQDLFGMDQSAIGGEYNPTRLPPLEAYDYIMW